MTDTGSSSATWMGSGTVGTSWGWWALRQHGDGDGGYVMRTSLGLDYRENSEGNGRKTIVSIIICQEESFSNYMTKRRQIICLKSLWNSYPWIIHQESIIHQRIFSPTYVK